MIFGLLTAEFAALSCKRNENNCGTTVVSVPFLSRSHNAGLDCAKCHVQGSTGKGCFTISGTVYQLNGIETNPNAVLNLRTQPNGGGDIRHIISTDGKGNFFTTNTINWADSLYVELFNPNGGTLYKSMPINSFEGSCNTCHNTAETRLMLP